MIKKMFLTAACCCLIYSASAQVFNQNKDWKFQRLSTNVAKTTLENQGTSWESQFNVTHTSVNAALEVSKDTLQTEFTTLLGGTWEKISLPHTPFIEDFVVLHQWQGICYYKKELTLQPSWKGQKIWLEFEGAMHLADVWVNGVHVSQHAGGYTPFVIDLTGKVKFDTPNEITVRLDNRNNPLIPPGKPLEKLDFCYYGGIYRDVNLIVKPETYISHPILADQIAAGGIFVTYPKVSEQEAVVNVKTHIVNDSPKAKKLTIRHRLFETAGLYNKASQQGRQVLVKDTQFELSASEQSHQIQDLRIATPRLWSPDAPHLYILQTEILDGSKVVDQQKTRIGIRHIEFTKGTGFILNGKPIRLVGSNRHMDYPYIGNALSDNAQYRDIYQIKESGFNIVRLGHYPQDPAVLEACDELGLLAIEPIPGWQFFNKSEIFIEMTYRDVRDMIRRDRNHPSIVMWETTLNESWPPNSWKDGAVKTAHLEYPGDQCYTSGDGYGYDGFDVVYNDWKEGFHRPNPGTKAGFIREYYDYEFGGHYSTTRISRGDGEKALLQNAWNAQWSHNRYRKQYPWTAGDAIWSMYDYNRGCCDNVCMSGVADLFRLPKFSLDFFYNQTPAATPLPSGKMPHNLFIANYWTPRTAENNQVVIYGNVDQVELRVNGRAIARQKCDSGNDTHYVPQADGGNCKQLTYSPFTFDNVRWEKGAIEAVGYVNGKQVATQKRLTPEQPKELRITYFESGRKAAKNDIIIVYVQITDRNGTLCVENKDSVTLTVNAPNKVVGPVEMNAEAGIASFIVQTADAKELLIQANSSMSKAATTFTLAN